MMNLHPLALIDSLLEDYLTPQQRRTVHTLILLAVVLVMGFLGFEGDWKEAALAAVAAIYAWSNRANTGQVSLADAKASFCGEPEYDGTDEEAVA